MKSLGISRILSGRIRFWRKQKPYQQMDERGPPDAREPNKHPSLYMAEFMAAFSTVMLVIIRVTCPSNHHSPQPQIIPVVKGATYPKLPVGSTEEDNYFNNHNPWKIQITFTVFLSATSQNIGLAKKVCLAFSISWK